jgi:hypothetical protein
VKTLGNGVFWGSAIQSLTIPSSVTEIGKYLCRYCVHLKTVRIESSLIGEYMFTNCSAMTSLTITTNVEKIGTCALTYCSSLSTAGRASNISIFNKIKAGECVEISFELLYSSNFTTTLTSCSNVPPGEHYLAWTGRSNNSHPMIRSIKIMS